MHRLSIIVAVALLVASCQTATTTSNPAETDMKRSSNGLIGEGFSFAPPAGWEMADKYNMPYGEFAEFVPAGESIKTWTRLIAVNRRHASVIDGYKGDSTTLLDSVFSATKSSTDGFRGLCLDGFKSQVEPMSRSSEEVSQTGYVACDDINLKKASVGGYAKKNRLVYFMYLRRGEMVYSIKFAWQHDSQSAIKAAEKPELISEVKFILSGLQL